jgi:hypothetical protein
MRYLRVLDFSCPSLTLSRDAVDCCCYVHFRVIGVLLCVGGFDMQTKNVIHGDVKLDNVLAARKEGREGVVFYLADFTHSLLAGDAQAQLYTPSPRRKA